MALIADPAWSVKVDVTVSALKIYSIKTILDCQSKARM